MRWNGAGPHADGSGFRLERAVDARIRSGRDSGRQHLLAQLAASLARHLFAHPLADWAARSRLGDGHVARAGQHGARSARAHQTAAAACALNARLSVDRVSLCNGLVTESIGSAARAALAAPRRQDEVAHLGGVWSLELAYLACNRHDANGALHRLARVFGIASLLTVRVVGSLVIAAC